MKQNTLLRIVFYVPIALCATLVVIFENELLVPGWLAVATETEFLCTTTLELLTVCAIPVAFRLIRPQTKRASTARLLMRYALLAVPMMLNTAFYYAFLNVAFGYMAIILTLCMLFFAPTKKRIAAETNSSTNQKQAPDAEV